MVCIKPVENFNIERILAVIANRMLNAPRVIYSNGLIDN